MAMQPQPRQQLVRVFALPGAASGGNPAPVWLGADGLDTAQMQEQTRASCHESVFVLKPSDPTAHRWRMRYFVPRHEMEMCGHATVGALWLLAERGLWDGAPVRIETLSGTVEGRRGQGMVEISQPRAMIEVVDDALAREIAACLRIDPARIVRPVLNAATSRVKTLVRLESPALLHSLDVDLARVESLCGRLQSTGLYPFAVVDDASVTVSARQFPRASGYPEDAATGIAAAALAWGLRELSVVGGAGTLVTVRQGEAMGSPSMIQVRLPAGDQASEGCWLRGEACEMTETHPPEQAR